MLNIADYACLIYLLKTLGAQKAYGVSLLVNTRSARLRSRPRSQGHDTEDNEKKGIDSRSEQPAENTSRNERIWVEG